MGLRLRINHRCTQAAVLLCMAFAPALSAGAGTAREGAAKEGAAGEAAASAGSGSIRIIKDSVSTAGVSLPSAAGGSDFVHEPEPRQRVCNGDRTLCYLLSRPADGNILTPTRVEPLFPVPGNPAGTKPKTGLPHRLGPLYTLVTNDGHLVFIEEFYRSAASRYAVMVLDRDLRHQGTWSFTQIVKTAGVPQGEIDRAAKAGRWLSAKPSVINEGTRVLLPVSDRKITVGRNNAGKWTLELQPWNKILK